MPWVWCVCCPLHSPHHCPLWFSDLPTGFWLHICCHGTHSPHRLASNPTDRARLSRDRPCTTQVTPLSSCLNPSFPSCPQPPVCRGLVRGGWYALPSSSPLSAGSLICGIHSGRKDWEKDQGPFQVWQVLPLAGTAYLSGRGTGVASHVATGEWTKPVTFCSRGTAQGALTLFAGAPRAQSLPPLSTWPLGPLLLSTGHLASLLPTQVFPWKRKDPSRLLPSQPPSRTSPFLGRKQSTAEDLASQGTWLDKRPPGHGYL